MERLFENSGKLKRISIYEIIDFISNVSKNFIESENFEKILKEISKNTDYSEEIVKTGIKNAFLPFQDKKNIKKILRIEIGNEKFLDEWIKIDKNIYLKAISPPFINAIFSGNIPGIEIEVIFPALLSKTCIYAKPSYKMHYFLKEFKNYLEKNFKDFSNFIEIEIFKREEEGELIRFLKNTEILVIQGEKRSINEIKKYVSEKVKVIEYPSMFGAGILKFKDFSKEILKNLSLDIFLYNHRGCMSPFIIFIEEGIDFEEFCVIIDKNIKSLKEKFNAKEINLDEKIRRRQIVDSLLFDKDLLIKDLEFKFIKTKKIIDLFFPGIIQAIYYKKVSEVFELLFPFKDFLQAFSLSSYDREIVDFVSEKTSCIRITKWGKMQFPGIFFPNKGNFGIKQFIKFCVLEK